MTLTTENILLIGSILLFISLIAGKTSARFGIPVLVFFLIVGMLAGSEGIGGIQFNNPRTAQFIGIVALNFILFSGGLDTRWQTVRYVFLQGVSLSTLGVLVTAISVGIFVWAFTDFTLYEGLLLGSIISSTDSAAVFSILRSKSLALKGHLRSTLELESGSNDPMAYILTIAFTGLVVNQDASLLSIIPLFLQQMIFGGVLGFGFGMIGKFVINRIRLDFEGLYIVLMIALVFFTFSATNFLGGNGFLAVYLCAIYLGNQELIHKRKFLKSFDSFAWLMQIVMFLTLGLLVFPSQIIPVVGIGLLISAFLIFIARPLSVMISLIPFHLQNRHRWFISWVGLRGAVPIVFATYPLLAGAEKAQMIFNVVFFISLSSVLIQGSTLHLVARWLHLTLPEGLKQRSPHDMELVESTKSILTQTVLPGTCEMAGKPIVQAGLPLSTTITMIKRNDKYLIPDGSTVLQPGDTLFLLSENTDSLNEALECLNIQE